MNFSDNIKNSGLKCLVIFYKERVVYNLFGPLVCQSSTIKICFCLFSYIGFTILYINLFLSLFLKLCNVSCIAYDFKQCRYNWTVSFLILIYRSSFNCIERVRGQGSCFELLAVKKCHLNCKINSFTVFFTKMNDRINRHRITLCINLSNIIGSAGIGYS